MNSSLVRGSRYGIAVSVVYAAALALRAQECLIISEVIDGNRVGGTPKFVEITNTGSAAYTFSAGGIIIQANDATDRGVDIDLTGVTILPGAAYVAASTANDGRAIFIDTYGREADWYGGVTVYFGNGDDRYILTDTADGSHLLDIFGELDIDGTGTLWEYTDGYAYRLPGVTTGNGGAFVWSEWFIAMNGLKGLTETQNTDLLRQNTTPGSHAHGPGCGAVTGACCFNNGSCDVRAEAACQTAGGRFRGVGTVCAPQGCACRGDANCDGFVNFADINPFVATLSNPASACGFGNCDVNGDGVINFADINPFVAALGVGGACP